MRFTNVFITFLFFRQVEKSDATNLCIKESSGDPTVEPFARKHSETGEQGEYSQIITYMTIRSPAGKMTFRATPCVIRWWWDIHTCIDSCIMQCYGFACGRGIYVTVVRWQKSFCFNRAGKLRGKMADEGKQTHNKNQSSQTLDWSDNYNPSGLLNSICSSWLTAAVTVLWIWEPAKKGRQRAVERMEKVCLMLYMLKLNCFGSFPGFTLIRIIIMRANLLLIFTRHVFHSMKGLKNTLSGQNSIHLNSNKTKVDHGSLHQINI